MVFIYTTCKDVIQAKELGKKIIKARVAVCVNIWPIESVYLWENDLKEENEAVLMIKTNEPKMAEIEEFLRKHHTYSTPFIGGVHIDRINHEYKEWATQQIVR
ncbi:MAG: divalent-cation tolerance protein CutA [Patescibacteria group bacterium]